MSVNQDQKKGFKDRLNEIQEICLKIQNTMDYIGNNNKTIFYLIMFIKLEKNIIFSGSWRKNN